MASKASCTYDGHPEDKAQAEKSYKSIWLAVGTSLVLQATPFVACETVSRSCVRVVYFVETAYIFIQLIQSRCWREKGNEIQPGFEPGTSEFHLDTNTLFTCCIKQYNGAYHMLMRDPARESNCICGYCNLLKIGAPSKICPPPLFGEPLKLITHGRIFKITVLHVSIFCSNARPPATQLVRPVSYFKWVEHKVNAYQWSCNYHLLQCQSFSGWVDKSNWLNPEDPGLNPGWILWNL